MALKIILKPHEKFILGGAVITNGDAKSAFIVENDVPILREKGHSDTGFGGHALQENLFRHTVDVCR